MSTYLINWFRQATSRNIFFLFCILGFLAYGNAIFHPFVHDDVVFIKYNPYIADLNLRNIFVQTTFGSPDFPIVNTYYRPLLEIFNRLQYRLYGLNPFGFHLTNVLLHILNSFILFHLLQLTGRKAKIFTEDNQAKLFSLIISLIFLLHPVQSEAVACISGVSNLLSTLISLLVFYCYLKTIENQNRLNRFGYYILSLVLLFLGLLSKEQVLMVPAVILFFEILFITGKRDGQLRRILIVAGYFLVAERYLFLRTIMFGQSVVGLGGNAFELKLRLLSIPRMILTHLSLIFFPHGLHYYRNIDILLPKTIPIVIFLGLLVGIAVILLKMKGIHRRFAIFGLGWFLITLVPTLNIVALTNEYSLLLLAEHFLYLPLIGLLIFLITTIFYYAPQLKREDWTEKGSLAFVLLLVFYTAMSVYQNNFWRSEVALFEHTVAYENNFSRAEILLAKAYAYDGRFDDAIIHYNRALDILRGYLRKIKDEKVIAIHHRFVKEALLDLAHCYEAKKEFAQAAGYYLTALEINPLDSIIYFNLGITYIKIDQIQKAIHTFEEGLRINPRHLMMKNSLAICYKETGRLKEAQKLLEDIVRQDPQSTSAKENLKSFMADYGNRLNN